MATLADLPNDVIDVLATCFRPHPIWMPVSDIVQTASALAMAGRSTHALAAKLHAKLAELVPWEPMDGDEAMFTTLAGGLRASSTVPSMRGVLRERGLKVSGRKTELWERLLQHAREARPLDFPINTTPATHRCRWTVPRMDIFQLQAHGLTSSDLAHPTTPPHRVDMCHVRDAILAKFGMRRQHDKYMEDRNTQRRQLDMARAARRTALVAALSAVGCTLRRDSRLCREFIQGQTTRTLEQVVDAMAEMRFFFAYTHYRSILGSLARLELQRHRANDDEDTGDESPDDEDIPGFNMHRISEQAKGKALKRMVQARGTERSLEIAPLSLHTRISALGL